MVGSEGCFYACLADVDSKQILWVIKLKEAFILLLVVYTLMYLIDVPKMSGEEF